MNISEYITHIESIPYIKDYTFPWEIIENLKDIIIKLQALLPRDQYTVEDSIAIHNSAEIEDNVTIKPFTIIGKGCTVRAGAYLREGVLLAEDVTIGTNCEIKQSLICTGSRIAHLNYIGNSIIGEDVNIEAGAIVANHFNEREDKEITVIINGKFMKTGVTKFGSLIGDKSRIGANAVLNPGTILKQNTIVDRLTHINQGV